MTKIQSSLLEKVKKSPGEKYPVLIVINENTESSVLKLSNFSKPMSNTVATTIEGKKIIQLSKLKDVLSIEEDSTMEIS